MSKTTAQVFFFGLGVDQILADNPDVHRYVLQAANEIPHAIVKAYVSERPFERPMEWSVSVASPSGRSTFTMLQRVPLGPIHISSE